MATYLRLLSVTLLVACASRSDPVPAPGTEGRTELTLTYEDGTQEALAIEAPPGEHYLNFLELETRCVLTLQASNVVVGDLRPVTKAMRQRILLEIPITDAPGIAEGRASEARTRAPFLLDRPTLELERARTADASDAWVSGPGGLVRIAGITGEAGSVVTVELVDVPMAADPRNVSKRRLMLNGRTTAKLRALSTDKPGGCPAAVPGRSP
jgi:hypothetical protein